MVTLRFRNKILFITHYVGPKTSIPSAHKNANNYLEQKITAEK